MSILFPTGRRIPARKFHEAAVRGRYEPNLRMIRGTIDTSGAGSILFGSGFTIVRNGVGDITITFDPLFAAAPSVLTTVETTVLGTGSHVDSTVPPTVSAVRIQRYLGAVASDGVFDFVAIGPIT